MLLVELANPFPGVIYGAWVDTKNRKIHPVQNRFEHEKVAEEILGIEINDEAGEERAWSELFGRGFVRVARQRQAMFFQGTAEALLAGVSYIGAAVGAGDVGQVNVTIVRVSPDTYNTVREAAFDLPAQRREAMMFVKGETS